MQTQRIQYPLQRTLVHEVEHDDYPLVAFRYHLEWQQDEIVEHGDRVTFLRFPAPEVDEVVLGSTGYPPEVARFLLEPDWYDAQVQDLQDAHNAETQSF
jgi:hypothetical protein